MRSLIPPLVALLSGCATLNGSEPQPPVRGDDPAYQCREGQAGSFEGQIATAELGARMLAATGARRIRWVPPGAAITMDFSPSRLTVRLDAQNRILSASCG